MSENGCSTTPLNSQFKTRSPRLGPSYVMRKDLTLDSVTLDSEKQLTDIVDMIVDNYGSRLSQGFAYRAESQ